MGQLDGKPVENEANGIAQRIKLNRGATRDALLAIITQREAWIDTARQNQRNADYWEARACRPLWKRLLFGA